MFCGGSIQDAVKGFQEFIPANMGNRNASIEIHRSLEMAWMMLLDVALLFADAFGLGAIISLCKSALEHDACNANPFVWRVLMTHQNGYCRRRLSFQASQSRNVALAFQHVLIARQCETPNVVLRLCERVLDICDASELALAVREAAWRIYCATWQSSQSAKSTILYKVTTRAIQACRTSKALQLMHFAASPASAYEEQFNLMLSLKDAPVHLISDPEEAFVMAEDD